MPAATDNRDYVSEAGQARIPKIDDAKLDAAIGRGCRPIARR